MKKTFLYLVILVVSFGTIFAEIPTDYILVFQNFINKDGKTNQYISRTYRQGINKFRNEVEIETNITSQTININGGKETSNNITKTSKKSLRVIINRYDKGVLWDLNLDNKTYREQPISQTNHQNNGKSFVQIHKSQLTKIGEDKLLGYICSIYTLSNQKYWISKDFDLILKTEQVDGSKSGYEALELRFEKPDDTLFEIPQEFRKIE